MYLKTLTIKNFRALTDISLEFSSGINVIVGPNAIGKTTILGAIRLAKSLLSQRVASEAQQTLISLGGVSPHNPTQLIVENLAQDKEKMLEIKCGYKITVDEFDIIKAGSEVMATNLIRSRFGNNNIAEFVAFLSSEAGQASLAVAVDEVASGIKRV
ncbi:AAA family ATPase [Sphingomonas sp. PWP1-2]|uniref:AAA family ATPase n=1 Tax=Sphingomonas sp. PWP1-2 TaxID=2804558 RepID=UPI003CEB3000